MVNLIDMSSTELRDSFDRDGFVRVSGAFSAEEIELFRGAAQRSIELTRAGKWPYFRSLPKQFPPWSDDASQGIWGVQHLLHPDLPDHKIFAQSYFCNAMVGAVTSLLGCPKEVLVMELYNMLVRPDRDFALRWHRDDIGPGVSIEEETARLQEPIIHAQWNLALYDDSSLVVVPGSHKRARTIMERGADPFEDDMPGQKTVKMYAGDIVFYNNNILHRGVYDSRVERMTLHGSMGIQGLDHSRARNILQHGIGSWADKCDFTDLPVDMASLAENMKQRLLLMGRGDELGYSQLDS